MSDAVLSRNAKIVAFVLKGLEELGYELALKLTPDGLAAADAVDFTPTREEVLSCLAWLERRGAIRQRRLQ